MLHSDGLFICAFVSVASNSGHFQINDFLLFFTPLLLLNYFLFNLLLFLQKRGGGGAKVPHPLPLRGPCVYLEYSYQIFNNYRAKSRGISSDT